MSSAPPTQRQSVVDAVSLRQLSPDAYESVNRAGYNGGLDPRFGYGGWTVAFGINAAAATVSENYDVYSAMGSFLAQSLVSTPMRAKISRMRDSRSFATRRVDLFQVVDGKERGVMLLTVDFMKPESRSVLTYSDKPLRAYSPPHKSLEWPEMADLSRKRGAGEKGVKFLSTFQPKFDLFQIAHAPEGMMGQTLSGATPAWDGPVDALPMPQKTTCEYFRSWKPVQGHLGSVLAIAYMGDAGSAYLPPALAKVPVSQWGPTASLDFALRIFANDIDSNSWLMREERTIVGGDGRAFSEATTWDYGTGKMVAKMSQQTLLRPPAEARPAKM